MPGQFLHGVEVVEIDSGQRPLEIANTSVIGIVGTAPRADAAVFPLNTPVLIAGSRAEAAKLLAQTGTSDGTLPAALDSILDQTGAAVVVVRVEESELGEAQTLSNVVGGFSDTAGGYTGVHALLTAENALGVRPRILVAPGWTHQRPDGGANPVVSELLGIAERLRAVIIADGPNTNDATAQSAAQDFGSARVYLVDPWIKKFVDGVTVVQPASPCVAGLIAKIDNTEGFWYSPSNHEINGITGTARPIDFVLGDPTSRANLLNGARVATIIRSNGYRLWGNRSLSSDSKWMYLCVRRTADVLNDTLQREHMYATDKPITRNFVKGVTENVNAKIRELVTMGALLGGRCWADSELNTPGSVQAGNVVWNFDFTPPYPAEHITFRAILVNDYVKEVFE